MECFVFYRSFENLTGHRKTIVNNNYHVLPEAGIPQENEKPSRPHSLNAG